MPNIRISEISMESFLEFSKQLAAIEDKTMDSGLTEQVIELCSGGGESYAALAFVARMRLSPLMLKVIGYGYVASAATLILASGDKRCLTKEAWVMVHEDQGALEDVSIAAMEREAAHLRNMESQWVSLLTEVTNTSFEYWTSLHQETTYLTPTECLELGMIDEII